VSRFYSLFSTVNLKDRILHLYPVFWNRYYTARIDDLQLRRLINLRWGNLRLGRTCLVPRFAILPVNFRLAYVTQIFSAINRCRKVSGRPYKAIVRLDLSAMSRRKWLCCFNKTIVDIASANQNCRYNFNCYNIMNCYHNKSRCSRNEWYCPNNKSSFLRLYYQNRFVEETKSFFSVDNGR